jgi:hypothetical protein
MQLRMSAIDASKKSAPPPTARTYRETMELEEDDGPHLFGAKGVLDVLHERALHQGASHSAS